MDSPFNFGKFAEKARWNTKQKETPSEQSARKVAAAPKAPEAAVRKSEAAVRKPEPEIQQMIDRITMNNKNNIKKFNSLKKEKELYSDQQIKKNYPEDFKKTAENLDMATKLTRNYIDMSNKFSINNNMDSLTMRANVIAHSGLNEDYTRDMKGIKHVLRGGKKRVKKVAKKKGGDGGGILKGIKNIFGRERNQQINAFFTCFLADKSNMQYEYSKLPNSSKLIVARFFKMYDPEKMTSCLSNRKEELVKFGNNRYYQIKQRKYENEDL